MKKIILSLLLIVSSLASLTACDSTSKIKKYSNKVEVTTFAKKLGEEYSKKVKIFDLFLNDCEVGYVEKAKSNLKEKRKNVNKTLKGSCNSKYEEKGLYDVDNNTTIYTNKYTVKGDNLSNTLSEALDYRTIRTKNNQKKYYCVYNDEYYELDLKAKFAVVDSYESNKSRVADLFPRLIDCYAYSNAEYYIDDNIYTIIGERYDNIVTIQYTFTERNLIKTSIFTREFEIDNEIVKIYYKSSKITEEYMKFKKVNNRNYSISKYIVE